MVTSFEWKWWMDLGWIIVMRQKFSDSYAEATSRKALAMLLLPREFCCGLSLALTFVPGLLMLIPMLPSQEADFFYHHKLVLLHNRPRFLHH